MRPGERQVAPTHAGIRKDHLDRYRWAATRLTGQVYDLACGVGYGSKILADHGLQVCAIDIDKEALEYGQTNYADPKITYTAGDLSKDVQFDKANAAVVFECIEHMVDPRPMLKALAGSVKTLLVSVPNEEVFPWANYAFHHRHYTHIEFAKLLAECGWRVTEWHGQQGPESPVEPEVNGRTVIAVCVPSVKAAPDTVSKPGPKSVAIIGLGPSKHEYASIVCGAGGRRELFDETWVVNAAGDCYQADMIWHMDDVRIQEIRAAANPDGNIAKMLKWLKTTTTPVMTSRAYADYPATRELPLEALLNDVTFDYFNNTVAWAVAYAIHIGVQKIAMFGCDYTYKNRHTAERGRGCLEFWLGYAAARGVKLQLATSTSLMDACEPRQERLYGYDTRRVIFEGNPGKLSVSFAEIEQLPTAEEIEWRYNHDRHPNPVAEELHEGDAP